MLLLKKKRDTFQRFKLEFHEYITTNKKFEYKIRKTKKHSGNIKRRK